MKFRCKVNHLTVFKLKNIEAVCLVSCSQKMPEVSGEEQKTDALFSTSVFKFI